AYTIEDIEGLNNEEVYYLMNNCHDGQYIENLEEEYNYIIDTNFPSVVADVYINKDIQKEVIKFCKKNNFKVLKQSLGQPVMINNIYIENNCIINLSLKDVKALMNNFEGIEILETYNMLTEDIIKNFKVGQKVNFVASDIMNRLQKGDCIRK
ncbi:MAG: hypothetical protein RSE91_03250, partial [Bacilli bacterium]